MAGIRISNDPSGRIIVSFPYDPLLVSKVKTIDGRRWHPVEKHWSFPKLNGMLEKILKVLGDEGVQIDPALQANLPKTSSGDDKAKQKQFQFEDLRRGSLFPGNIATKRSRAISITTRILSIMWGRTHRKSKMMT